VCRLSPPNLSAPSPAVFTAKQAIWGKQLDGKAEHRVCDDLRRVHEQRVIYERVVIILELCSESPEKELRPELPFDRDGGVLAIALIEGGERRPVEFIGTASRA
jgi:hypothetical protein